MPWLIAWLQAHAAAIAIIGATAGAVASVESVALNTDAIVQKVEAEGKK